MSQRCEMVIGQLVPRRCDNRAVANCSRCSRKFCEEHVEIHEEGILCRPCITGEAMPIPAAPLPSDISEFKEGDFDLFDETPDAESDYKNQGLMSSSLDMFDDLSWFSSIKSSHW